MARHVTKFKIIYLHISIFYTISNYKHEGREILKREKHY
jgi:hypothetical protein